MSGRVEITFNWPHGACSHHGGVNSHEVLYLLILGISVGAGAFTSNFLSRGDGVPTSPSGIGRREPSFSNEIELITNAIENQKRIEFFYKKPSYSTYAKRTVRPKELTSVSHKYGSGYTLCVKGYCELRKDVRSFALKRMTNLRVISDITLTN